MVHRFSPRTHRKLMLSIVPSLGLLVLSFLLLGMTTQPDTAGDQPVLLFGIGVHIEPFGAQVSPIAIQAGARPRTLDPLRCCGTPASSDMAQELLYFMNYKYYLFESVGRASELRQVHGQRTPYANI